MKFGGEENKVDNGGMPGTPGIIKDPIDLSLN